MKCKSVLLLFLICLFFIDSCSKYPPEYTPSISVIKIHLQLAMNTDAIIFETSHHKVELYDNQALPGRVVVRLKRACGSLSCVRYEDFQDFITIHALLEKTLYALFGARPLNVECLMNNAFGIVPNMPLVHWHITPRYKKPVTLFGKYFADTTYGHRNKNPKIELTKPERRLLIKKIQEKIQEIELEAITEG